MQCNVVHTYCFSLNQFKFKRNHSHMIAVLDLVGALCIYLSELIWLYITRPNNVHCSPNQHPNRIGFMLRPHIQQFISCWTSQSINKSYIIFKREAFELSDWMNFQKSFNGCGSCLYKKNVYCKLSFILLLRPWKGKGHEKKTPKNNVPKICITFFPEGGWGVGGGGVGGYLKAVWNFS